MRKWLFYPESIALALAGAWSAAGCLATAFLLPMAQENVVCGLLCLWAVVCTFLMSRRRGVWIALLLLAASAWGLWWFGDLQAQSISLLGTVVNVFDMGYGFGVPRFLQVPELPVDYPLGLLGMVIIAAVTGTVCRRKGGWLAMGMLLLPLFTSLVVTDTVPSIPTLFTLLLCLVLLLLTDSVRAESGDQGTRLTMTALIPAAVALALLLHFVPQEGYENRTVELRKEIIDWLEELPEKLEENNIHLPNFQVNRTEVDLSTLGAQPELGLPVAEVVSTGSGTIYLRQQDYDRYTGTAWQSTPGRQETLSGTGSDLGSVTVRTLMSAQVQLVPSFPAGETILTSGALQNEAGTRVFSYGRTQGFLGAFPDDIWLSLPQSTQSWAQQMLQSIPGSLSSADTAAQAIAGYVRSSAVYDRMSSAMDPGSNDFARWFLEEADEGYCVHFATAAAVLLRAAGIPARYVTGYKVETLPGETIRVSSNEAHAWVEYYDYRTWTWSILEATPADIGAIQDETEPETQTQTMETEETVPPETTHPQETTAPTTEPTTEPTQPTEPEEQGLDFAPLLQYLPWVLSLICAAVLLEGQRALRIHRRKTARNRGTANRRAIAWWNDIQRMCRLTGKEPPEELSELAEKAMFSQHTLTREEITAFTTYAAVCQIDLQSRPWWKRAAYRYWFAVI